MGYRKLGRSSAQRKALLRDLTTQLLINGSIQTTEARAKEVRRTADKMITLGKHGDLASRRKAAAFLRNVVADVNVSDEENVKIQNAVQYLFNEVAPRFEGRAGGYTRILKMDQRRGDAAPMVLLQLVD
ncbi:50S ribosomal protein L17 [Weissella tructae]|jgi:large subunit ribosomal protein L17|uniref:Large ribosomal subunit protein bL17 n=2 Tax=Weissella TaxID=46255 RepID=A0A075TWS5_9LACO|nr:MULTISPECIES: 50S ribosomal protein L17 [Weissella]AIG66009.1 50S ribosomal protein L17 [Weissella tructae]AIM63389.1 50S ribosomal protein L17 [Weissella ceti]AIM64723.1 50S ribosomal protein L17 [Weissella ceti]ELA07380.1 50S ribosomal protein L17 [Weissella ceti NC36]QVV91162.1 50S ribosomal protein L17 [Weissella tructae]